MIEVFRAALERRAALIAQLHEEGTDCVRLLHGATEGLPGMAIDRYGPVLLVQTWRDPLDPGVLEGLAELASAAVGAPLVPVWNHRPARDYGEVHEVEVAEPVGREGGLAFDVRPRHRGRDPLLFLDLRAGRRRVRAEAGGRSVLNLFAYTCAVGVCAAAGGASEVWNVDFARSALDVGAANTARNGLEGEFLQQDCFPVLRQLAGLGVRGRGARKPYQRLEPRQFDLVVLDPPRRAKSAFGVVDVVADYPALLKPALLATRAGGAVLATNHVASVSWEGWMDVVRRCAKKAGRTIRSVERIEPEGDFPSPDGRAPLKVAWLEV